MERVRYAVATLASCQSWRLRCLREIEIVGGDIGIVEGEIGTVGGGRSESDIDIVSLHGLNS